MPPRKKNREDFKRLEGARVVKANELIQKTSYHLTLQAQKALLFLLSQISPESDAFTEMEFSVSDFARSCGIEAEGGRIYEEVKRALYELHRCEILYYGSPWIPLENGWEAPLHWIEKPYASEKRGRIRIRFDRDMLPFLLHLRERFTEFELIWTLQFKSGYSVRLYEYLKSRHFDKLHPYEFSVDLAELRERCGAENYTRWPDFNRRVLRVAVAEINAAADMTVEAAPITEKNRVTAVHFKIETKERMEYLRLYAALETAYGADQLSMFDPAPPAGDPQP